MRDQHSETTTLETQGSWSGTLDRGDGEADLEYDPPQCPDRSQGFSNCGGDAYMAPASHHKSVEDQVWLCSDCSGRWDGYGDALHDRCPECGELAHATESDDRGYHAECQPEVQA